MPNAKLASVVSRLSDFTVDDFANASVPRLQRKKNYRLMDRMTENLNWDENVDDDIDLVEQEDENGCSIIIVRKARRRAFSSVYTNLEESTGNTYPLDIWFLISKFIAPEDVGRFAAICRSTLEVTRSAEFWFSMYKRYYKPNDFIPSRLQPEQMKIRYGLRSCVIRSLFFTYPLFINKNETQIFSNFCTPKGLLKRKCVSMWYEKSKGMWIFFFKLKYIERTKYFSRGPEKLEKNIFDILDDVLANTELDCKILKVHCGSFSDAPPVMGSILCSIYTKVASNMRHDKLHLGFIQSIQDQNSPSDFMVVLNNVVKMEVLNWWNPKYPHSTELLPCSIIQNSSNSANYPTCISDD